jgi:NAD+ synthetase
MDLQQKLSHLVNLNYDIVAEYLVKRLREYIAESGKKGGIVGVSGGIDSAVVATLLSRATHNYFFLLLPSSSTPARDVQDALELTEMLGGRDKREVVEIDGIVREVGSRVKSEDPLVLGNAKARIRMTLLYAFAQKLDYLVIGTGDKSEILLGYFTKYGDGGVDVLPIGDLYKTQVRLLGRHLGVPEKIVTKPSSPALWEGQTAEGELGLSYEVADAILYSRFEEMKRPEEVAKELGVDISLVRRVDELVMRSQHKRLPPEIFRLSGRAINSDWRYPRAWA